MSVIIRLQNLPLSAISIDIRNFFHGLSIPDGGVHIVGGPEGDAFIAFSTDEDARQAMQLTGQKLKDSPVRLLLSSRNEMFKVIEQARVGTNGGQNIASSAIPPSPLQSLALNSPNAKTSSSSSHDNVAMSGNFPQLGTHPGMLGMGLGMNGASNFLNTAQAPGIMLPGFGIPPATMTAITNTMTSTDSRMTTTTAPSAPAHFGIPPPVAGMGFPSMLPQNAASGFHGINPALMMNMPNMGVPPPMLNLNSNAQGTGNFPPRNMNNMQNGLQQPNSNHTNNHNVLSSMGQNHSGNNMGFSGMNTMNPAFMAGNGMNNQLSSRMGNPGGLGPHAGMLHSLGPGQRNFGLGNSIRPGLLGRPPSDFGRDAKDDIHSSSVEHRDRDTSRRRRSRSRERDRGDRRRRSKSRSKSRSPKIRPRRDSRDKDDRRNRTDVSPSKGRGRRDSRDADPPPNAYNMTDEHHPAIKLTGVPTDASFREIKDFLRVDIMGGGDGTVRVYHENIAYVKLEKASDFPKSYRSNGRRLRNSVVSMEGIPIERWVDEYKLNKSRLDRDIDKDRERIRDRVERHSNKDKDDRGSDRDTKFERDRSDKDRERSSRPSRFNNASQSSYIVIRNLPPTITSRDVSFKLLKDSAMIDMVVAAGPFSNGRHTAVAYVKLDSPEEAQKTIDLIVRSQDGSHLVVEASTLDDFNKAKERTPGLGRNDADSKFGVDAKSIFDLESGLDDESCSVLLRGAPPNASERDVFDFFSDIGLVPLNVKLMYDTQGMCNGQIICEFPDPHLARRATTKDGMLLGRGQVQVELVPTGRTGRILDPGVQMKGSRPSLLGMRPRFGAPPGPNPFVQALQGTGNPRSAGSGAHPRSRGPNHPRFGLRNDFGSSNGTDRDDRMGAGRGRSRNLSSEPIDSATPSFGKSGCVLALENVPFKASMDDILHHLSSILNLDISRERIIRRFDESEKPTGDARVAFDTAAEAKLAHDRLVGTKMWNRLITYTIL